MPTRRLPLSDDAIQSAAAALRAGLLVAFPTETVYGLGARADRSSAVRRIFEAKGRPATNPLIVHVPDRQAAAALAAEWSDAAEALARAFWPGPLTLVVKRAPGAIADLATAGGATVALRVPAHPVALDLLRASGVPIAAPSANRSTTVSPTTADHVLKTLDGAIDLVLDAGPTGFGIESTIVDVSSAPLRLLRHGAISATALAPFGEVIDRAAAIADPSARAEAPGMHAKHYAPVARAILAPPGEVRAAVLALRAAGRRAGAIERAQSVSTGPQAAPNSGALRASGTAGDPCEVLPADAEGYARELYAALHRLDDAGCDDIVIATVPEGDDWAAVRDRLRRATA